jgi:DMSO/TMAO reductase YedYZ molybdopterin-dependent catalytic subunit
VIKVHHFAPFIPLLLAGMAPAQEAPTVAVAGAVAKPLTLAAADLAKLPRATVTTRNDGLEVVYAGVWLHEVLKAAGVPAGSDLRGKALTLFVVAEAADGYQVVFSLAELDPAMGDHPVLLADQTDGKALFGAQGSFRLVAPKDKRGARGVRMLKRLEVVQYQK